MTKVGAFPFSWPPLQKHAMRTMFRSRKTANFTTLPNKTLRDESLSFKARGMLAMILSHFDEWEVRKDWLEKKGLEGREAISSGLRELEEAGYAVFARERSEAGVFCKGVWTFYDEPVPEDQRTYATRKRKEGGIHTTGSQSVASQISGNPHTKKYYIEEESSEEKHPGFSQTPENTQDSPKPKPEPHLPKSQNTQSTETNQACVNPERSNEEARHPHGSAPSPAAGDWVAMAYKAFLERRRANPNRVRKSDMKSLVEAVMEARITEQCFVAFLERLTKDAGYWGKHVGNAGFIAERWNEAASHCLKEVEDSLKNEQEGF